MPASPKERIISRLQRMRRELRDMVEDIEWWNENRTDAEPFDSGWDRMMLHYVERQLDAWEAGDTEAANTIQIRMNELMENCP